MKNFLKENWYKLMIGSSLLMASFGFMIYSITPAEATDSNNTMSNLNYRTVPLNADGTISVRLSDEQLNKIVPKNEDGSINIKLSENQLKALEPNPIQSVNLLQIQGYQVGSYEAYKDASGKAHHGLAVDRDPWQYVRE